jgi:hypothetical protein
LANRDGLKAAEVKELVGTIQQQSLKLFEATQNAKGNLAMGKQFTCCLNVLYLSV